MTEATTVHVQPKRLLDQMRERLRYLHYSLRTEQAYVYWLRQYVLWSGKRHPKDMGREEVEGFLTHLAVSRRVSPATHRQALSALLFLYKEVLSQDLPWLKEIGRPPERRRIPAVLTVPEVQQVLGMWTSPAAWWWCAAARAARTGW